MSGIDPWAYFAQARNVERCLTATWMLMSANFSNSAKLPSETDLKELYKAILFL